MTLQSKCLIKISIPSKFPSYIYIYVKLTGHCWHSPVDLPNKMPPHISWRAGLSVCSIKSHHPLQQPGRSYRGLLSRSSRGGRSETSEPLGGSDKMADHGENKMTRVEPAALEEWMTQLSLLLSRTSPGSLTLLQDLDPMETTDIRQCGTEIEQQHLSHSLLGSSVSSLSPFLLSWMTY